METLLSSPEEDETWKMHSASERDQIVVDGKVYYTAKEAVLRRNEMRQIRQIVN